MYVYVVLHLMTISSKPVPDGSTREIVQPADTDGFEYPVSAEQ